MFFYTRYPSSNMLKTYFSDVKVGNSFLTHLLLSVDAMGIWALGS